MKRKKHKHEKAQPSESWNEPTIYWHLRHQYSEIDWHGAFWVQLFTIPKTKKKRCCFQKQEGYNKVSSWVRPIISVTFHRQTLLWWLSKFMFQQQRNGRLAGFMEKLKSEIDRRCKLDMRGGWRLESPSWKYQRCQCFEAREGNSFHMKILTWFYWEYKNRILRAWLGFISVSYYIPVLDNPEQYFISIWH